jgi:ribosomal protein L40E
MKGAFPMKFRRNLFGVLALLTLLLACVWIASGLSTAEEDEVQSEAERAGRSIGEGIGVTLIVCITVPFIALFALLSWRNDVGIKTERRHQEQLRAAQAQRMPPGPMKMCMFCGEMIPQEAVVCRYCGAEYTS